MEHAFHQASDPQVKELLSQAITLAKGKEVPSPAAAPKGTRKALWNKAKQLQERIEKQQKLVAEAEQKLGLLQTELGEVVADYRG